MYIKKLVVIMFFLFMHFNLVADDNNDLYLLGAVLRCNGEIDEIELLLNTGANPNIRTYPEDVNIISAFPPSSGELFYIYGAISPLMIARHYDVVNLLIKHGADINDRDNYGRTALMLQSYYYFYFDKNIVPLLLEKGADVNIKDNEGQAALYYAIYSTQIPVIMMLIKNGADVNVKNNNGFTPLQIARFYMERYHLSKHFEELVNVLETAGAVRTIDDEKNIARQKSLSEMDLLHLGYSDR